MLALTHPSGSTASIEPVGAHVARWTAAGFGAMLFASATVGVAPPRGGVPVVFPQFAELGSLPLHGFAHSMHWHCVRSRSNAVTLELTDTGQTRRIWPHRFGLRLTVVLSAAALRIALAVHNRGDVRWEFRAGLHPYLLIGDVDRVGVRGLSGIDFEERVTPGHRQCSGAEPALDRAIDRVYVAPPRQVTLHDTALQRRWTIERYGFSDFVIWNPGPERDSGDPFLQPGEYRRMICIEAAQVSSTVQLAPGERWRGAQTLRIAELA